ncbi:lipoprotein insertase outer membrane protein LolB [Sediminicurvatus halobius]|uniref:Outer-membrane lipoprotein LolB n=1 Tax=Sediminicurvatus halobius TaxID=2182432 RepID=A0A2U2N807_9GAMM|nr:lipoprotein insertase outer membrane protein LolB [Spiribacter halobius]PWG65223.1 outer membrane lipoprotein LolB [Spiribacter halobius]UEX78822.1 lipoprotein insertase outer membrane protein LolB [Spiribacter halobius]
MSGHRRLRALWRAVLPLAATLLLGGCAVVAPQPDRDGERLAVEDWAPPLAPDAWQLQGRTALRVGGDGATASLFWREAPDRYRIDLRGAFGAGAVRVEGEADQVTLRTGDGSVHRAGSARELVRAVTGYDLPVEYLRWWVRARPVPWLGGQVRVGAEGLPQRLEQEGWVVRYEGFTEVGEYRLPQRLEVSREDVLVRLVVRQWELAE